MRLVRLVPELADSRSASGRRPAVAALVAAALWLTSVVLAPLASAAPPGGASTASPAGGSSASSGVSLPVAERNVAVCDAPGPGQVACAAIRRDPVDAAGRIVPAAPTPRGYGPGDLRAAYRLTGNGSGRTVAIVDAFDAPTAEADLAVYRTQFGLPPCTTANGCFRKVSQTGSTTQLPQPNPAWAQEISLDIDMVSAVCSRCSILLVEANGPTYADLAAGVTYAASQGVIAISNSYRGDEVSDPALAKAYDHPGIAVTAATGDVGYGIGFPASYGSVIGVGGTTLTRTARGWSESAWRGAGSGCSALHPKPAWQPQSVTSCARDAAADVSAVADPATGVAVYDSYAFGGQSGWLTFGGTSVASPIIASIYAMGRAARSTPYPAAYTWRHKDDLTDVTTGSNGTCPTPVWCNAGPGWDGPTGLGTPRGTGAF